MAKFEVEGHSARAHLDLVPCFLHFVGWSPPWIFDLFGFCLVLNLRIENPLRCARLLLI
ncbi:hypothetical protein NC652_005500 [Populus alba x Populus x berolinensis]|nr:hypothetical protein NC652_005500 [Populus alba x Populus x berolinensis]